MSPCKPVIPIALTAALALSACAQPAEEETVKKVGVEDVGGGELQVADPQPGEIPVNLPKTPMKNVPAEDAEPAEPDAEEPEAAD